MDPLEIPETADRASWYGVVSHPHVRFDGILFDIGATSCDQVEQDYRDLIEQRLADTGGMSPVEITGGYDVGDTDVSIEATFRLVDPVDLTDLRASLLVYEDDVFYCCGYGGVDTWPVVTRRIHDEEIVLQNVDDEVVVSAEIPIDPEWDPEMLHVVAYLQNTATKEVIQGLYVEPSPASVDDLIGGAGVLQIDAARPTPFRQATEIAFTIPSHAGGGRVLLEIVDLQGRRVAALVEGNLETGVHLRRWDGTTTAGAPAGSGIYFARLATNEGTATRKLLLLE
ncbi:MAG: T9SS type A sorting domain-containing protein [Candidatus Latescibacteria bacterium]|nr:T9SS type A sorting domain-containing protein [Candidatus Latescibacterota bacterium]